MAIPKPICVDPKCKVCYPTPLGTQATVTSEITSGPQAFPDKGGYGKQEAIRMEKGVGDKWDVQVMFNLNTYNCAMATISGFTIYGGREDANKERLSGHYEKTFKDDLLNGDLKEKVLKKMAEVLKAGKSCYVFHDNIKNSVGSVWYTNFKNVIPELYARQKELGLRIERTPIFNNKVYGEGNNPGRVWTIITTTIIEPGRYVPDQEKTSLKNNCLSAYVKLQPDEEELIKKLVA